MSAKDITVEPDQSALVRGSQQRGQLVTMPRSEPVSLRDATFAKSGTKALSRTAAKVLRAPVHPTKEVDILTTGEIYMSHVFVRRRLNNAVGPMGWALRPISEIDTQSAEKTMFREYALIIHGRVVATAFGSAKYYPKNARMDYADTAEAVKSNALTRSCKDLGIGSECWDRQWCDEWRDKYAVHVWVKEKVWDDAQKKRVPNTVDRWRRYSAKPLHGELEIVRDSPNQDKWRAQYEKWIKFTEEEAAKSRDVADRMQKARRDLVNVRREAEPPQNEPANTGGESAADVRTPEVVEGDPASEARRVQTDTAAQPSTSHTGANGVAAADRAYLVRECKIVDKQPTYTLYRITMMDGAIVFTFSDRVYGIFQGYLASRERVQVYAREQSSKGKKYPHIYEWKELRTGAKKQ